MVRERLAQILFMLRDWVVYLRYRWTAPAEVDFVSMGLGIRARYRRNRSSWAPHLERSKKFIETACASFPAGGTMAVLGAGNLYDFPESLLRSERWQIDLYDYNPALMPEWKALKARYPAIRRLFQHDLTGIMQRWSAELANLPEDSDAAGMCALLRTLPERHPPRYVIAAGYSSIVTLNLLSQLGLYWRDRVEKELKARGLLSDGEVPAAVDRELARLSGKLERAHLLSIGSARPEMAVLICDTEYLYYNGANERCDHYPALSVNPVISGYRSEYENSWLWHIAPQGVEEVSYGEMHQVMALRLAPEYPPNVTS